MKKEGGKDEILFRRGIKIQGLNRVAIPKELLENCNLQEGENVALFFDSDRSVIVIKKDTGGKNE